MCRSLFSCLVDLVSVRKRDSRRHVVLMAQFHTSNVKAGDFIAFSFIRSVANWLSHFAAIWLSPLRVNNFTCKKGRTNKLDLCCFVVNNNIEINFRIKGWEVLVINNLYFYISEVCSGQNMIIRELKST